MRTIALKSLHAFIYSARLCWGITKLAIIFTPLFLICIVFALLITIIGIKEIIWPPAGDSSASRLEHLCNSYINGLTNWTKLHELG
jgi:hypothetical protein